MRKLIIITLALVITLTTPLISQASRALNGNDLCREYMFARVAKSTSKMSKVLKEGVGELHYFRYLYIEGREYGVAPQGYTFYNFQTIEPSSGLKVHFQIVKSVSKKMIEEQDIDLGEAIAVTGRIKSFDKKTETFVLEPVVVRHKDKLAPTRGKEILTDIIPDARYYTFTAAGKENMVIITGKDKDLVPDEKTRDKMRKQLGELGFANHLKGLLAARAKERDAARKKKQAENAK